MWTRLLGVPLLGAVATVSALASAAAATPTTPLQDLGRQAPPHIARAYDFSGVAQLARWYTEQLSTASARAAEAIRERGAHLSHAIAARAMNTAGLGWKSSGGCVNREVRSCTSLQAVRYDTLHAAIVLKFTSDCPVTVTGGTERGHARGLYSHGHGYKLDIAHNSCIDQHITGTYRRTAVRGDGAPLYRAPEGMLFADENDHWDILFR